MTTVRFNDLAAQELWEAAERYEGERKGCAVSAGGAMPMSPLLLHASSASRTPARRRVLHFEYSAARLPYGLAWA